jgi:hypothetical protein
MKTGMQLNDPKQVMGFVSDALSKGKITHKEAVDITTVYRMGVSTNTAMRNFEGFGLQPSYSYKTKVEIDPNSFSSTAVVDLTKYDTVSRALMQIQSRKMRQEFMDGKRNVITGEKAGSQDLSLFNNKGVDPTSMFQPNPGAAKALDAAADSVGPAVENFFRNLPRASDFENKATGNERRRVSGKITGQGQ